MTQRTKKSFLEKIQEELYQISGKDIEDANDRELYLALGVFLRKEVGKNLNKSNKRPKKKQDKEVFYLSMEFLTGTFTKKNLQYLDLYATAKEGFKDMDRSLDKILAQEKDPGLGNGGLGRLAVAFLDSLASLDMPGHGYGLRYEKGLFKQKLSNNRQVELPDDWEEADNIWEFKRANESYKVRIGGRIEISGSEGKLYFNHVDYNCVKAVPY